MGPQRGSTARRSPQSFLEEYVQRLIQASAASCVAREQDILKAAIVIQKHIRGYGIRTTAGRHPILTTVRGKLRERGKDNVLLLRKGKAALKIQTRARGHLARREWREYLDERENCATLLQALARGFLVRRNIFVRLAMKQGREKRRQAAVVIQARWKGKATRDEFRALKMEAAGAAELACPGLIRIRPRSARPPPPLTTVIAQDKANLENLLAGIPAADLSHTDVRIRKEVPRPASAMPRITIEKIRLRPQSAKRRPLNDRCVSAGASQRLARARLLCADTHALQENLLGHVDKLKWSSVDDKADHIPPTFLVGEAGALTPEDADTAPWLTPRAEPSWSNEPAKKTRPVRGGSARPPKAKATVGGRERPASAHPSAPTTSVRRPQSASGGPATHSNRPMSAQSAR
ncbi:hypothetical protein CYMTET_35267 [Cymbomonas tetramitiformis]|uniref:Uncharacterized protein n=1 Tax=Cymbomonas tetramitiformis TaxID=36881 RepID=A0AAE0F9M2_9CHLO|nr:hypothetical protein CYMTET_35267 [Cymbomonas tetramitiformis]